MLGRPPLKVGHCQWRVWTIQLQHVQGKYRAIKERSFLKKMLKICRIIFTLQGSFTQQSSSWRCQEDFRRGGGNCNFDLCVPCMKTLGVNFKLCQNNKLDLTFFQADHIAAWPIIRKLAELINLNNHPTPTEEEYADFKRMIKPIPPQLVRKYFF